VRINSIGIVGVGPRGLSVLERIVAHAREASPGELEILLFDPQEPGSGAHDPGQSSFHLVNTVAGQLTLFSDATVVGAGPVMGGPTFFEWLRTQSRMDPSGPLAGVDVGADSYYPRGYFGRYLQWVFRYVRALAPPDVRIRFVQSAVERAWRDQHGAWVLHAGGERLRVDYLFLTTGHTKPKAAVDSNQARLPGPGPAHETQVIGDPYPMKEQLASIAAGMSVAIEGMGLTAMDVIAELTVGRGGRFIQDTADGKTRYIPSGNEPALALFSRSGIPLSARAINQKGVSGQYRARFLRISDLRELRVYQKLDFESDVLPLLFADMEYAYYEAYLRGRRGADTAASFCSQFAAGDPLQRQALVAGEIPPEHRLSWDQLVQPIPATALQTRDAFASWLMDHLQHDLQEARRGNLDSPLKAACDVLRDLRDTLRAAIEFGGLSAESHRWVLSSFMPLMNRLAVGPPASRIGEMLALMKAGVLAADFGPGATCTQAGGAGLMRVTAAHWGAHARPVQVLVKARISMHSPGDDASPLLQGLLGDGHVRLFRNQGFHPGGIEVDRQHRWVNRDGAVVDNAWALGIPTEGVKFCTFVIPRTGVNSTAMADAGRAVAQMLSMIERDSGEHSACSSLDLPSEEQALVTASQFGGL
jgi:FAD-NAD(P)-binding